MEILTDVELAISSPAFSEGESIPEEYTCDGVNKNPKLRIDNLPADTKSMAVIVEDPDAPGGTFDHWVVWNILPTTEIEEHETPGVEGINSFGRHNYKGPCPPDGEHRYFFRVYALSKLLNLDTNSGKDALLQAMDGHVLATGQLMGRYRTSL